MTREEILRRYKYYTPSARECRNCDNDECNSCFKCCNCKFCADHYLDWCELYKCVECNHIVAGTGCAPVVPLCEPRCNCSICTTDGHYYKTGYSKLIKLKDSK